MPYIEFKNVVKEYKMGEVSIKALNKTNFTIEKTKDSINFTTKGYGHGAGMSQYGANFMAQDGSTYEQILLHYYNGISLQKVY